MSEIRIQDQRSADPNMIPPKSPIAISHILSTLVKTTPPHIPPPSGLFPSLCDVYIRSPPRGASTSTLGVNRYDDTTACSHRVWSVPQVFPNQLMAFRHVSNPSNPWTILPCNRCGGGKTHVTLIAGVVKKGVIFYRSAPAHTLHQSALQI